MQYHKWFVQPSDLIEMNPEKARDMITRCFFEAQKESFAMAGKNLGQTPSDEDLQTMIVGAIRLAFRETKHDYDHPTREALADVVQVLARKSAVWQTPLEIIDHHKEQIGKVLERLT